MNSNTHRVDMLSGSLFDKIILFALPLAASSIMQQLFTAVDVAIVGLYAGTEAQAAVGCNGHVINLILNLFIGISVGANVVIAHFIGQRDGHNAHLAVRTALSFAAVCGVVLSAVGIIIAKPVLTLLDTPPDVLDGAVLYMRIFFLGVPFLLTYNFGAAVLRSIGDTRRPLIILMISGVANASLNMLLVIVFEMGVAGVAIATATANFLNALMVLRVLKKHESYIRLDTLRPEIRPNIMRKMLTIGVPAGLQAVVFSLANVCIQASINEHGAHAVAGSAVALNYEYFTYFVMSAFTQSCVTFTSQNFAAGNMPRCRKIFRQTMLLATVCTGIFSATLVTFDHFFSSLFTSDPMAQHYAMIRMEHVLLFNCIAASYEISAAAMRGMGYSLTPAVLMMFGTCALRLVWIYWVCPVYNTFQTLMDVYPISWVITGVAVVVAYIVVNKRVTANLTRATTH